MIESLGVIKVGLEDKLESRVNSVGGASGSWGKAQVNTGSTIVIEDVPKSSNSADGNNRLINQIYCFTVQAAVDNKCVVISQWRIGSILNSFAVVERESFASGCTVSLNAQKLDLSFVGPPISRTSGGENRHRQGRVRWQRDSARSFNFADNVDTDRWRR